MAITWHAGVLETRLGKSPTDKKMKKGPKRKQKFEEKKPGQRKRKWVKLWKKGWVWRGKKREICNHKVPVLECFSLQWNREMWKSEYVDCKHIKKWSNKNYIVVAE